MLHIGPLVIGTAESLSRENMTNWIDGFEAGREWGRADAAYHAERLAGLYDDILGPVTDSCGEHEWCDGEPCMLGEGAPDGPPDHWECGTGWLDPESATYATSAERDRALDAYYASEQDHDPLCRDHGHEGAC